MQRLVYEVFEDKTGSMTLTCDTGGSGTIRLHYTLAYYFCNLSVKSDRPTTTSVMVKFNGKECRDAIATNRGLERASPGGAPFFVLRSTWAYCMFRDHKSSHTGSILR